MVDAWFGLVLYAYGVPEHREAFKNESGIDIENVAHAMGITAMIDKASGFQSDAVAKWADWVTRNLWGVEENEQTIRPDQIEFRLK